MYINLDDMISQIVIYTTDNMNHVICFHTTAYTSDPAVTPTSSKNHQKMFTN